jgi:pantothenate synthetase
MGNLHAGHESLLQKSKQENTISVLTEILGEFNFSG